MSVIVEFSVPTDQFGLGSALETAEGMKIELERVVPTANATSPFFWAAGRDYESFEREVLDDRHVESITALDTVDGRVLYRLQWADEGDLLDGIVETDGIVLEAFGNGGWFFRIRFSDHDRLGRFYNYCRDHDVPLRIERVYTLIEEFERGHLFQLTQQQREALVLALQRGYYDSPAAVTLTDLAGELGISQQALSKRLRRGNKKVLSKALLPSATSTEADGDGRTASERT